jgi:hypothetical protein
LIALFIYVNWTINAFIHFNNSRANLHSSDDDDDARERKKENPWMKKELHKSFTQHSISPTVDLLSFKYFCPFFCHRSFISPSHSYLLHFFSFSRDLTSNYMIILLNYMLWRQNETKRRLKNGIRLMNVFNTGKIINQMTFKKWKRKREKKLSVGI